MARNYTSISVPKDLVRAIENYVEESPLYSGKAEFIKEALREHLNTRHSKNFDGIDQPIMSQ